MPLSNRAWGALLFFGLVAVLSTPNVSRAQIVQYNVLLDFAQEFPDPPVPSTGTGTAVITIDTATNTLTYSISYEGLTSAENNAHIHGFAGRNESAGVLFPLPLGSPKNGSVTYTEEQEEAILTGLTYINIHTVNNPNGEIRGQIDRNILGTAQCIGFNVSLDFDQEFPDPPVPSTATGTATVTLNTASNTLFYSIAYEGLTSAENNAHIHGFAGPNVSGGVLFPLPSGNPKNGSVSYTEAQEQNIIDGLTYINIHSVNNPNGEIRGQIAGAFPCGDRNNGDFDSSGCTDVNDFLYLLDNWNTITTQGPIAIGVSDFLALLDSWTLGPFCA